MRAIICTFLCSCFLTVAAVCQDATVAIARIDKALADKSKTISQVLTDTELMYLHSLTPFREVIKKHANTEVVSIAANSEPGVKMVVNGKVTNAAGKPLVNVLIYFYHTSDKGWYSDTGVHILQYEGDHRHARLFGYVKTDSEGKFTIKTIRPNGYPKSDFAAHIHLQFWDETGKPIVGMPGELQFDDDVRMTEQRRKRSLAEGFLIAVNEGTKEQAVYTYLLKPRRD